jgi:hypothetical protein
MALRSGDGPTTLPTSLMAASVAARASSSVAPPVLDALIVSRA